MNNNSHTNHVLGRIALAEITIQVVFFPHFPDNEDPIIRGCPSDQSINTDSGKANGTVSWTPATASDNSGSVTLTSNFNPEHCFPIGDTTVTYTATDGSGNLVSTCSFVVTVAG